MFDERSVRPSLRRRREQRSPRPRRLASPRTRHLDHLGEHGVAVVEHRAEEHAREQHPDARQRSPSRRSSSSSASARAARELSAERPASAIDGHAREPTAHAAARARLCACDALTADGRVLRRVAAMPAEAREVVPSPPSSAADDRGRRAPSFVRAAPAGEVTDDSRPAFEEARAVGLATSAMPAARSRRSSRVNERWPRSGGLSRARPRRLRQAL